MLFYQNPFTMARGDHFKKELTENQKIQKLESVIQELNDRELHPIIAIGQDHKIEHYLSKTDLFKLSFDVKKYKQENLSDLINKLDRDVDLLDEQKEKNNYLMNIFETVEEPTKEVLAVVNTRDYYRQYQLKERLQAIQSQVRMKIDSYMKTSILHPHPVNFQVLKKIYNRDPLISSSIEENGYQRIQPGFQVEVKNMDGKENKEAIRILENFIYDPEIHFSEFLINALINWDKFGNSYIQPVVFNNEIVRLYQHDPEYMFVETDPQRTVLGYWEFGEYQQAHFFPYEMIHWKKNATVEDPYGYSVIIPLIEYIKRELNVWADAVRALHRYGSPFILWIFGNENVQRIAKGAMDAFLKGVKNNPSNDIGAPYGVDAKTLGADFKVAMNYVQYLEELRRVKMSKLKTPSNVLGVGGKSGEQARESLEAYDKRSQTDQQLLANNVMIPIFRLELNLKGKGVRKSIIRVRWNRFDRIERDKKEQNLVKMVINGILTPREARERIGLTTPLRARDMDSGKTFDDFGEFFNILPQGQDQGQGNTTGSPAPTRTSDKNLQTKKNQTKVKK